MLTFQVGNLEDVVYTRVGLVSKVASLFDRQGMVAPLVVKAKIKLRELGTRGLQWNDPVNEEDRNWWGNWLSLQQLDAVEVPRCLFPKEHDIIRTELHGFGDASEEAHAAVIYLRQVYTGGAVIIRQVRATTKLAPKKTISIPKLELNASLQLARLAKTVGEALSRRVHRRYLWTDSSTVRNWVRATGSNYQIYVSQIGRAHV